MAERVRPTPPRVFEHTGESVWCSGDCFEKIVVGEMVTITPDGELIHLDCIDTNPEASNG